MTDSVLKSIMRLFAIIANLRSGSIMSEDNSDYEYSRRIAEAYLGQLLNREKSQRFLQMFDFHYKNLQRKRIVVTIKRISLFSVKTLLISEQLNQNLTLSQRILVFFQLVDIIKGHETVITEESGDFLNTIASLLNISEDEQDMILLFIFGSLRNISRNESFLIISGQHDGQGFRHHLYRENLSGNIVCFYFAKIQTYFFTLQDNDDALSVNGRPIVLNRVYLFEKGSVIRSHRAAAVHYSDIINNFLHRQIIHEITLAAHDVAFKFSNSDNGIRKFSFACNSGQLVGVMGGSGVGKSTLLKLLNGSVKPDTGSVTINNIDIYTQKNKVDGLIGFIPQDDFLIEELSVFDNLYYNAKLCLSNVTDFEIRIKIDKLLVELDLFDTRNLLVGSPLKQYLSGGQRKRLNIALELLREPSILYVDEPTSGLSSTDSEKVIELLKQQTFNGKLVVVNIHQPSSDIFKLFDRLLVLDKGGRAIYFGNTTDALPYFKNATQLIDSDESECVWCGKLNPEQILHIVETCKISRQGYITNERLITPEEWHQMFLNARSQSHPLTNTVGALPVTNLKTAGGTKQFVIYMLRNMKSKLADKQYLLVNLLEAPLLALILGFFTHYAAGENNTYQFSGNVNIPAYLFMAVVVSLFLGLMGSAEEIIRDAKILKRESLLNLSRYSYIHSKVVYLFLISAIQTFVFLLITTSILEIHGMFLKYWLVLFSASCFANMLGLILSAGLRSVVAIYIFIPLLLIPQILISGVIVKFDKLHSALKSNTYVPLIGDLMASRWAYEAIAVSQFKDNKYQQYYFNIDKQISDATYCVNFWIPEILSKLDACTLAIDNNHNVLNEQIPLLKNEVQKLSDYLHVTNNTYMQLLTSAPLNSTATDRFTAYIKQLRGMASRRQIRLIENKDKLTAQLVLMTGSQQKLLAYKNRYHNNALADVVLNRDENEKILSLHNLLQRKYEPIYQTPASNMGRAQFYAAYKTLGHWQVETYWFNCMVIWLMVFLLYILLLYNALDKIVRLINKYLNM